MRSIRIFVYILTYSRDVRTKSLLMADVTRAHAVGKLARLPAVVSMF